MNFDFLLITMGDIELKLAPELVRRGYTVGVISGTPKHYKDDIELMGEDIPYWHLNDLINKYKDKIRYDDEAIKQIKEKYDIPCLHSFYFPHFYYRMSYCGFDDFYEMSNHSESDYLFRKTIEIFQAIEYFFEENSVKYTIQNLGGEILRRVVFHHNKKFDIPNIIISWTPLPGHYVLISNEIGKWDELEFKKYDELSSIEIVEALDFINEFRNKGTTVKLRELKSENISILKRLISYFLDQKRNSGSLSAIKLASKAAFNKLKKGILYPYLYSRVYKLPNPKDKFFFFPLHYHAESRLTLRDAHCWRQEFIVEYVARSLPQGHKLYVKPHPEWPTDFPYEGLKMISQISNVVLVPPSYRSVDLIKKCVGAIVINSSAGFEALMYGKPVIVFGTEFYSGVGITYDVKDLRESPKMINEALTKGVNEKDLICFVNTFLKANRKGDFCNLNEENIKLFVDGILDYIEKKKLVGTQTIGGKKGGIKWEIYSRIKKS